MPDEDLKTWDTSMNKTKTPEGHGIDEIGDVGLSTIFNHVTIFSIQNKILT